MSNNTIHIIGVNHGPHMRYVDLKKSLVHRASKEELIFGLEGLVRNKYSEELHAREFYGIRKGFLYGIEEDFPLMTCHIASNYFVFSLPKGYDNYEMRITIAKASLVMELLDSNSMGEIWKDIQRKLTIPSTTNLYNELTVLTKSIIGKPRRVVFPRLSVKFSTQAPFNDNQSWLNLYQKIGMRIIDKLTTYPEYKRLDIDKVKTFFNETTNPENTEVIVHLGEWRNGFMFPNMRYVSDIGLEKGLDTYFMVGFGHTDDLAKLMKDSYPDREIIAERSEESIPDRYRYLLN